MARPRVFVSSTYYDLKHVRASLEAFIERVGYEPILSEKGDIAFSPDVPLDESCYREVGAADILVLIVGGRYGSQRSDDRRPVPPSFFERYDSITKSEYRSAVTRDIPIYVFIETAVYAEYQTFLRNKVNKDIAYAHVDSVNVFHLIEDILNQPRNNPIKQFDRYEDIESWLRDQWAGLFKEFLSRTSSQKQIASLGAQVAELAEINQTMRRYLEEVVSKVSPTTNLIAEESHRLEEATRKAQFEQNMFVKHMRTFENCTPERVRGALERSVDFKSFVEELRRSGPTSDRVQDLVMSNPAARRDINEVRGLLGLRPFTGEPAEPMSLNSRTASRKIRKDVTDEAKQPPLEAAANKRKQPTRKKRARG